MVRISKHQALENLEDILKQAAQGEEIIIEDDDGAQFTLTATKPSKRSPQYGSAKQTGGWMSDDFDEPLDDFLEYMS